MKEMFGERVSTVEAYDMDLLRTAARMAAKNRRIRTERHPPPPPKGRKTQAGAS